MGGETSNCFGRDTSGCNRQTQRNSTFQTHQTHAPRNRSDNEDGTNNKHVS